MKSLAIVFDQPQQLDVRHLTLTPPSDADVVVKVEHSSISAGTERLLWTGRMPVFPGMGYPLVPGYEAVGRVVMAGKDSGRAEGDIVFVAGANCYEGARGLFGASASHLVVPGARAMAIDGLPTDRATLLALAATAVHALRGGAALPELVIGHGVFGRLVARIVIALGGTAPTVWEKTAERFDGAMGYAVTTADADARRDYPCILDASGDASLVDGLVARLARGGELVLAGFYATPITFAFPLAFMKEARFRVATEFTPRDLAETLQLITSGKLSLDGLITHTAAASEAPAAYPQAFEDPACLKMVLDWRQVS